VRVATWNVNGLRARLDFVLRWLGERKPDVVGLQELKLSDEQFPHEAFEALGYRAATHGQKSWNGVAILAREPLEVVQRGLPGQGDQGARLLTARVRDLEFTTLYVPNGKHTRHEDFPRKLDWLDALCEHLAARRTAGGRAVVCGDFNLCPTAIDSWNEAELAGGIFHTDSERERFARLLGQGFVDVFRALHPAEAAFSWWDYRGGAFHRRQGLRIDLLLASQAAATGATDASIDREWRKKHEALTPSDHAPVLADLAAPGPRAA
jgi:exodeoxyribonuclease-3